MRRPMFIVYRTPWWRSRRAAVAALVPMLAVAAWVAYASGSEVAHAGRTMVPETPPAVAPHDAAPIRATPLSDVPPEAARVVDAAPRAVTRPASATPLSTMVAPGVHVTPLSVPGETAPMPAGPRPDDSESEN